MTMENSNRNGEKYESENDFYEPKSPDDGLHWQDFFGEYDYNEDSCFLDLVMI